MNELANTLRMYAEDMHSRTGFNYISRTMSQAADMLEELEKERDKLILAVADNATARCELAAQNVAFREALSWAERNMDAETLVQFASEDDCHCPFCNVADFPGLASEVLKRRDAEVLRRAADRLQGEFYEHAAADVLRMVSITPDDHDA